MAVDVGAAPTRSVSKTDGLLLSQSTISRLVLSPFNNSAPTHHRWLEAYVAPNLAVDQTAISSNRN